MTYTYPGESEPRLKDIDLDIPRGQFVGIIGPSGSGKTTLVRCISALAPHVTGGSLTGKVNIGGTDISRDERGECIEHMGVVFQNPHLQQFSDNVIEELAFPMENFNTPRKEMERRIGKIIREFHLERFRGRNIHELSGGEKQILAVATALIREPNILILDEPTSELDSVNTMRVKKILARLRGKITVILVEHRHELLTLADRIIGMKNGRKVVDGALSEKYTAATYEMLGLAPPPELVLRDRLGSRFEKIRGRVK